MPVSGKRSINAILRSYSDIVCNCQFPGKRSINMMFPVSCLVMPGTPGFAEMQNPVKNILPVKKEVEIQWHI